MDSSDPWPHGDVSVRPAVMSWIPEGWLGWTTEVSRLFGYKHRFFNLAFSKIWCFFKSAAVFSRALAALIQSPKSVPKSHSSAIPSVRVSATSLLRYPFKINLMVWHCSWSTPTVSLAASWTLVISWDLVWLGSGHYYLHVPFYSDLLLPWGAISFSGSTLLPMCLLFMPFLTIFCQI